MTTQPMNEERTTVENVDLACVDPQVLDRYVLKYGLKLTANAPIATKVTALAEAIRRAVPKAKIADCDNCGGDSSIDDDECPFCGVSGFEGPKTAAAPKPTPKPAAQPVVEQPKPAPKKPAPKPEVEPAAAPKPAAKKRSEAKKPAAVQTPVEQTEQPASDGDDEPVVEQPKPRGKKSAAVAAVAEVVVAGEQSVGELVSAQAKSLAKVGDVTIDEAVAGVIEAKRLAVVSYWQLGSSILRCFENDLWKQRRDDKGHPTYKGFSQFVEAELGMAAQYAYKLMNIAATFSAQDVTKIGVAKLGVMLRLQPADRDRLLNEVRGGMPFTEVADRVAKLAAGTGPQQGQGKKDMSNACAAAMASRTSSEVVTATFEAKRIKMPLFCRPIGSKGAADAKRAKRLADDPWGEVVSLNGITLRLSLSHDSDGRLLALVELRKPAATEKK